MNQQIDKAIDKLAAAEWNARDAIAILRDEGIDVRPLIDALNALRNVGFSLTRPQDAGA